MFIRDKDKCEKISTLGCSLREMFNPLKDDLELRFSMAHTTLAAGDITKNHRLHSSEMYYIIKGKGVIYIDGESEEVKEGQAIYVPPNKKQRLKNTGNEDLVFLCMVDPAYCVEDEEILDE